MKSALKKSDLVKRRQHFKRVAWDLEGDRDKSIRTYADVARAILDTWFSAGSAQQRYWSYTRLLLVTYVLVRPSARPPHAALRPRTAPSPAPASASRLTTPPGTRSLHICV